MQNWIKNNVYSIAFVFALIGIIEFGAYCWQQPYHITHSVMPKLNSYLSLYSDIHPTLYLHDSRLQQIEQKLNMLVELQIHRSISNQ